MHYIVKTFDSQLKSFDSMIREAFKKKKRSNLGKIPNLPDPPLPTWEPLTVFFIAYLGSMDHEMDFESNLFFSLTKVVWHLEKFSALPYIR